MAPTESPSMYVSERGNKYLRSDPQRTVVWLTGEHDIATSMELSVTLAEAAGRDDADIVVDLSDVTFMDASTIDALVVARDDLRACSRSLHVRTPTPRARRLFNLCGLADMIDEHPAKSQPPAAALSSWVDVPAWDRGSESPQPPVTEKAPAQEPAHASAQQHAKPAGSLLQRRAPS